MPAIHMERGRPRPQFFNRPVVIEEDTLLLQATFLLIEILSTNSTITLPHEHNSGYRVFSESVGPYRIGRWVIYRSEYPLFEFFMTHLSGMKACNPYSLMVHGS